MATFHGKRAATTGLLLGAMAPDRHATDGSLTASIDPLITSKNSISSSQLAPFRSTLRSFPGSSASGRALSEEFNSLVLTLPLGFSLSDVPVLVVALVWGYSIVLAPPHIMKEGMRDEQEQQHVSRLLARIAQRQ